MSTARDENEDVHNIERRYENAQRLLDLNRAVHSENRAKIHEFLTHCKAQDLRKARQLFYLQHLTIIATLLGSEKRFQETG